MSSTTDLNFLCHGEYDQTQSHVIVGNGQFPLTKEAQGNMVHTFNPFGQGGFFSSQTSHQQYSKLLNPSQEFTGVYLLKSPPFPGEAFFVPVLTKENVKVMYRFFCLVLCCNSRDFFPHHPPQSMRNPAPCMNGAYFKWSDSLRAVGGEEYPFGYLHCLAIRPMNWLEQVVFTGTGKLQSQTQTCISKHHRLGLFATIPLDPWQFKQGSWVRLRAQQAQLTLAAQQTVYIGEQSRDFLR